MNTPMIPPYMTYDPATGAFTNTKTKKQLGWVEHNKGRVCHIALNIHDKNYPAHRVAWFLMTGAWPTQPIDHIDGDPTNNKWENLRLTTPTDNSRNRHKFPKNKHGWTGVARRPQTDTKHGYAVKLSWHGRRWESRHFDTPEEAALLYILLRRALYTSSTVNLPVPNLPAETVRRIQSIAEHYITQLQQPNYKPTPINKTTGSMGVQFRKVRNRFKAHIKIEGLKHFIGQYKEEHLAAYAFYAVASRLRPTVKYKAPPSPLTQAELDAFAADVIAKMQKRKPHLPW